MSWFENLSADHVAVFGCGLALIFCLAILVVTPNLRQWVKRMMASRSHSESGFMPRDKQARTH